MNQDEVQVAAAASVSEKSLVEDESRDEALREFSRTGSQECPVEMDREPNHGENGPSENLDKARRKLRAYHSREWSHTRQRCEHDAARMQNSHGAKIELGVTLLNRREVECVATLSRSTLYRLMAKDEFPKSVAVSSNRRAWRAVDVVEWLRTRR